MFIRYLLLILSISTQLVALPNYREVPFEGSNIQAMSKGGTVVVSQLQTMQWIVVKPDQTKWVIAPYNAFTPHSVNDEGDVAGSIYTNGTQKATVITKEGEWIDLHQDFSLTHTMANEINNSKQVLIHGPVENFYGLYDIDAQKLHYSFYLNHSDSQLNGNCDIAYKNWGVYFNNQNYPLLDLIKRQLAPEAMKMLVVTLNDHGLLYGLVPLHSLAEGSGIHFMWDPNNPEEIATSWEAQFTTRLHPAMLNNTGWAVSKNLAGEPQVISKHGEMIGSIQIEGDLHGIDDAGRVLLSNAIWDVKTGEVAPLQDLTNLKLAPRTGIIAGKKRNGPLVFLIPE